MLTVNQTNIKHFWNSVQFEDKVSLWNHAREKSDKIHQYVINDLGFKGNVNMLFSLISYYPKPTRENSKPNESTSDIFNPGSIEGIIFSLTQLGLLTWALCFAYIHWGTDYDDTSLSKYQLFFVTWYWIIPLGSACFFAYLKFYKYGFCHNRCSRWIVACFFVMCSFCIKRKVNADARFNQALIIRRIMMSLIIFLGTEFLVVPAWKLHSKKIDLCLIVYCLFEMMTVLVDYIKYLPNCCDKDYFYDIYSSIGDDNK